MSHIDLETYSHLIALMRVPTKGGHAYSTDVAKLRQEGGGFIPPVTVQTYLWVICSRYIHVANHVSM